MKESSQEAFVLQGKTPPVSIGLQNNSSVRSGNLRIFSRVLDRQDDLKIYLEDESEVEFQSIGPSLEGRSWRSSSPIIRTIQILVWTRTSHLQTSLSTTPQQRWHQRRRLSARRKRISHLVHKSEKVCISNIPPIKLDNKLI